MTEAHAAQSSNDALPWSSAGPILTEDVQQEVRAVLTATVPTQPLPAVLDYAAARSAIETAWAAARADGGTSASDLHRLHLLDRRLAELSLQRTSEANDTLARVLSRLETAPCSVSELVRTIPQLICELGFSRGLISRVEGNVWTPELMYVVGDPQWSEELTRLGKTQPQVLSPGLYETELVHTRRSIIATGVQQEPWRSHAHLAPASQTRSYVAAPIVSAGEVVGILHGERYGQRRDVDELDRQMLTSFAGAAAIALSRAALAEALEATHHTLAAASRAAEASVAAVHRVPAIRMTREPGEGTGLVIRTGPAGFASRPLPDDLSPREREVLHLMAAGKSNGAIARTLTIAEGTVKQHVKHILRKLLVGSRAEAVSRWFQAGGVLDHASP